MNKCETVSQHAVSIANLYTLDSFARGVLHSAVRHPGQPSNCFGTRLAETTLPGGN